VIGNKDISKKRNKIENNKKPETEIGYLAVFF